MLVELDGFLLCFIFVAYYFYLKKMTNRQIVVTLTWICGRNFAANKYNEPLFKGKQLAEFVANSEYRHDKCHLFKPMTVMRPD